MAIDIPWPSYPSDTGPTDTSSLRLPDAERGFFVDYKVFDGVIAALQIEADNLKPANASHRPNDFAIWDKAVNANGIPYLSFGDYPAAKGLSLSCYQARSIMYGVWTSYHSLFSDMVTLVTQTQQQHLASEDHAGDLIVKAFGEGREGQWSAGGALDDLPEYESGPGGPRVEDGASWSDNHMQGYYKDHIRQPATPGEWDADYDKLYAMVHGLRPDWMDISGNGFHAFANGIQASRQVLYDEATDLAKGWHGATAEVALSCMQRLSDLGERIVSASWSIGSAFQWHAEKQRAWQQAVKPDHHPWWEVWGGISDHVTDELKKAIQQQTVDSTNAFPASIADPTFH